MASLRRGIQKSWSSCSGTALRWAKSSGSHTASCEAPPATAQGLGRTHCVESQSRCGSSRCGPKLNNLSKTEVPGHGAATSSPFASRCNSASSSIPGARRYAAQVARLPGELAAMQSLVPLHSTTADSRLVSRLGTSGGAPILQDESDGT